MSQQVQAKYGLIHDYWITLLHYIKIISIACPLIISDEEYLIICELQTK